MSQKASLFNAAKKYVFQCRSKWVFNVATNGFLMSQKMGF